MSSYELTPWVNELEGWSEELENWSDIELENWSKDQNKTKRGEMWN